MNKRIFSLVCIVLYSLLVAPTHCSEQKESGLRNRIIRAIKKIKRNDCIDYYRNYDKDAPKYVPLCCGLCCELEDDTGVYTYVLNG
ncbi:hypothetical protein YYC_05060 [Plasmodium yoelii 17X]|uniref:PYST-C1-like N-terminal domain-containing protein n=2 Tax=Plasmodium yoelii TaxID=5861 RepID=Q7RA70_PLAYO|nr:hypothetical protein [Plasmodium yoelii yoelii]ETB57264.1 hypothetical protein YYC_05060 [Plasmodium yoelii 17X]